MIPTIITGGTLQARALEVTQNYPPQKYQTIHLTAADKSLLISQIHDLIKQLSITSPVPRLVWLEEADKLTVPAQNALLKLLEEPPQNTAIVLSLANAHSLLATIRSRCTIKTLESSEPLAAGDLSLIKQALSLSDGDRVLAADSLGRKRDVLLEWSTQCLLTLDKKIQAEKSLKSVRILTQIASLLHHAHIDLKANVSVPLVMQNLFLHLPHTKNSLNRA